MKNKHRPEVKLNGLDALLGVSGEEISANIDIRIIDSFKDHPFKVMDDDKMEDLLKSIKENGVLSPVLVRPKGIGRYEMISGHRRLYAATLAGLREIPAIVRDMNDEEAIIAMVDANIQREELLPSEKAFAFRMKLDAMKRQGQRTDLTYGQNGHKFSNESTCGHFDHKSAGIKSRDILAEQVGESARTIQRYIRLTYLIPELLELVDKNRLQFTLAVEISYFNLTIQEWLNEYIRENIYIRPIMIEALKDWSKKDEINQAEMIHILNSNIPGRSTSKKITFSEKKLNKYFPKEYSKDQMMQVMEELLKKWKQEQEGK